LAEGKGNCFPLFIVFFTCDVENIKIIGVRKYGTER